MATKEVQNTIFSILDHGLGIQTVADIIDVRVDSIKQELSRNNVSTKSQKITPRTRKIKFFELFLNLLKIKHIKEMEGLKSIEIMDGLIFSQFIQKHNNLEIEIANHLFKTAIEKYLQDHLVADYVKAFKEKFDEINYDSLQRCGQEDPSLLVNLIQYGEINPFYKGIALDCLSLNAREEYFGLIKSFTVNESPFVREGAYLGLYEYYDNDRDKYHNLKDYFTENLRSETATGVQKQIKELLYLMD